MSHPANFNRRPHSLDQGEQNDVMDIHAAASRERSETREGFEPLSLWIVAGTAALLFWGGSYLTAYSGRFEADEFSELQHGRPVPIEAVAADPLASVKREGMMAYNAVCVLCHNEDGAGKPGLAPPLAGSDWVNEGDPSRLVRIVLHGLQGPIKINATTEFSLAGAAMPPQYDAIGGTDAKLAAVLTYVRSSWGNTGKPVTVDEVKAARTAAGVRGDPWTPAELMAIPVGGAASAPTVLSPEQLKEKLKALPAEQLQSLLKELSK